MAGAIDIISKSDLKNLSTSSLLRRHKELLACEESYEMSEKFYYSEPALTGVIEYKNSEQWKRAYAELKEVLASREHIARPAEKKAKRLAKANERKNSERRSHR